MSTNNQRTVEISIFFLFLISGAFLLPWVQAHDVALSDPNLVIVANVNGFHSGIILQRSQIDSAVLPQMSEFPEGNFLEFGWGDRAFYMSHQPGLGDAFAAALGKGESTISVIGYSDERIFRQQYEEIVELQLSRDRYLALLEFIQTSFYMEKGKPLLFGLKTLSYLTQSFFKSTQQYHAFYNCNSWVTSALFAAGCDIPVRALKAKATTFQAQSYCKGEREGVGILEQYGRLH